MRYLIEETTSGKYMIRYADTENFTDEISEETKRTVDILRVWQPTYMTHLRGEDILDEFGLTIEELKKVIGDCLSRAKFPANQWIQANILNVM